MDYVDTGALLDALRQYRARLEKCGETALFDAFFAEFLNEENDHD